MLLDLKKRTRVRVNANLLLYQITSKRCTHIMITVLTHPVFTEEVVYAAGESAWKINPSRHLLKSNHFLVAIHLQKDTILEWLLFAFLPARPILSKLSRINANLACIGPSWPKQYTQWLLSYMPLVHYYEYSNTALCPWNKMLSNTQYNAYAINIYFERLFANLACIGPCWAIQYTQWLIFLYAVGTLLWIFQHSPMSLKQNAI